MYFTGLEVLELADEKAGYTTGLLARLGARVIKIEPPGGSQERCRGPFFVNPGSRDVKSLPFVCHNVNKLAITLNLSTASGRSLFLRLLRKTDVLVESSMPDELERLRLDYGVLSDCNPRLIQAALTGFGRSGPRCRYRSCDLVAAAFGGAMHVSGLPDSSPLKPAGEQSHYALSLYAVLGILLALRKRKKTGRGDYLDISAQEAVSATLEQVLVRFFHDGTVAGRRGGRHWDDAFCIMPCHDGFIHMTVFHQWHTLVEWMAAEDMAADLQDEKFEDPAYRRSQADHILEVIGTWTKNHTVEHLFQQGQLMGFPWAPVSSPAETAQNPQLRARDFFAPLDDRPGEEAIRFPGLPFKTSAVSPVSLKKVPLPGEDNLLIYRDELGLSEEELRLLAREGVI